MAMTATLPVRSAAPVSPATLTELLTRLYKRQLSIRPDAYLEEHAQPRVIAEQVEMFRRYLPYLPAGGTVLDWGCNHAPDSCLLRAVGGDAYELYGCDFRQQGHFDVFHDYARLRYRTLDDFIHIPFADSLFEAVIASGTLEHTAMDYESLKEVHRVLKPGGVLVITYLPNRLSCHEFWRRTVRGKDWHRRLYGLGETRRLLLHTGFEPIVVRYLSQFWERRVGWFVRSPGWADGLIAILKLLLPVQVFASSTLFAVARKVTVM
jgi:ubiquinone/menaquinone biosynthesis C-methylase UbiE